MMIFQDLQKYGHPKKEHKDFFNYPELSKEERKQLEKDPPVVPSKKFSFWQNAARTFQCIGQLVFILVFFTMTILVFGIITKGCTSYTDTDHVHFEKYHP